MNLRNLCWLIFFIAFESTKALPMNDHYHQDSPDNSSKEPNITGHSTKRPRLAEQGNDNAQLRVYDDITLNNLDRISNENEKADDSESLEYESPKVPLPGIRNVQSFESFSFGAPIDLPDIDFQQGQDADILNILDDFEFTEYPDGKNDGLMTATGSRITPFDEAGPSMAVKERSLAQQLRDDIKEYQTFAKSPNEKVVKIVNMSSKYQNHLDQFSGEELEFMQNMAIPAMKCLMDHFNGDMKQYANHYADRLEFAKFKCDGPKCILEDRSNDLPERYELKELRSARLKLKKLIDIYESLPPLNQCVRCLTRNAYMFVTTSLLPVIGCLNNHFHGDIVMFLTYYDNKIHHSLFKKEYCSGNGALCNLDYLHMDMAEKGQELYDRHDLDQISDDRLLLQKLLDINSKLPADLSTLTPRSKHFVYSRLKPIVNCFQKHFHGDTETFLNHWKSINPLAEFQYQKCCGRKATICERC